MPNNTKIKKRQLAFIEHLVVRDLKTKKIKKSIFPAKVVQVGVNDCEHTLIVKGPIISDCADATTVISGNIIVLGSASIPGLGEGGSGGTQNLAQTLIYGEGTGGKNILLDNGSAIIGQSGTLGASAFISGGLSTAGAGANAGLVGGSGSTDGGIAAVVGGDAGAGVGGLAGVFGGASGFDSGGAAQVIGGFGLQGGSTNVEGGFATSGSGGSVYLLGGSGTQGGGDVHLAPGTFSITQSLRPTVQIHPEQGTAAGTYDYPEVFRLWGTIPDEITDAITHISSSWIVGGTKELNGIPARFVPEGQVGEGHYNTGTFFIHPGHNAGSLGGTFQFPGLHVKRTRSEARPNSEWYEFQQCYVTGTIQQGQGISIPSSSISPFEGIMRDPTFGFSGNLFYSSVWIEAKVLGAQISTTIRATYARKMRFQFKQNTANSPREIIYDYLSTPITTGDGVNWDAKAILSGRTVIMAFTGSLTGSTSWSMSFTACDTGGHLTDTAIVLA